MLDPQSQHLPDRSHVTIGLVSSLIVLSTTFICLRIYARFIMIKQPGLDDGLAIAAYVILMAQAACELLEVKHGEGREMVLVSPEDLKTFFTILPVEQLLYFAAIGLARLSIVAFLPRLNQRRGFQQAILALGAAIAITTIIFFFMFLLQCKPVIGLWHPTASTKCISPQHQAIMMYTHAGFGIFFDSILLAAPCWVVYSNMIWSTRTLKVMLVFSVGMVAFIMGLVRLALIVQTDMAVNTTYKLVTGAGLSDAEGNVVLWVSCFPTFQPIIRLISYKTGLRSHAGTTRPQSGRVPAMFSLGSSKSDGQERLNSQDGNKSTTHIIDYEGGSPGGREDIELGGRGGAGARRDDIVKETRIEVLTSPQY